MISDTLSEAINEIDRYLKEFDFTYQGKIRSDVLELRDDMERMRVRLDSSPTAKAPFIEFDGVREIAPGSVPETLAMVFCRKGVVLSEQALTNIATISEKKGERITIEHDHAGKDAYVVWTPLFKKNNGASQRFNNEIEMLAFLEGLLS